MKFIMFYKLSHRKICVAVLLGTVAVVSMFRILLSFGNSCTQDMRENTGDLPGCGSRYKLDDENLYNNKNIPIVRSFETSVEYHTLENHTHFLVKTKDDWFKSQQYRRRLVEYVCSKNIDPANYKSNLLRELSHLQTDTLFVDSKHNMLYCAIPKVACSSWKSVIASLTGAPEVNGSNPGDINEIHDTTFMRSIGLAQLRDFSVDEIYHILENYTKFMMVRHPLERLISAYRDKFQTENKWTRSFQRKYGRNIVRLYRENPTAEALAKGNDVTFQEFITFLTDSSLPGRYKWNPHWVSYQDVCLPCLIQYNFILKYDSFDLDSSKILEYVYNIPHGYKMFPKRNSKKVNSKYIMNDLVRDLSEKHIHRLGQIYKIDLQMYGYTLTEDDYVA